MKKLNSIFRVSMVIPLFGFAFATSVLHASAMQTSSEDVYLKSELSPYSSLAEKSYNQSAKPVLQEYTDYKNNEEIDKENNLTSSNTETINAEVNNKSSIQKFLTNIVSFFTPNSESNNITTESEEENYADKNFFEKLKVTLYLAYNNGVNEVTN